MTMKSRQAQTYLRLLADAELRRTRAGERQERGRGEESGPGRAMGTAEWSRSAVAANKALDLETGLPPGGLTRLVARTLATVGAVDRTYAEAIMGDLDAGLAMRGLNQHGAGPGPPGPAWPLLTLGREASLPLGPLGTGMRVIPLTARLPLELPDEGAGLELLAYVEAPAEAIIVGFGPRVRARRFMNLPAVDDQGRRYELAFRHVVPDGVLWEGSLRPPPSPGGAVRWLEVTSAEGMRSLRIELQAQALRANAAVTPVTARSRAELLAEAAAADLLAAALMPVPFAQVSGAVKAETAGMAGVLASFQHLGLLSPDSPALRRLLALCDRFGVRVPGDASQGAGLKTELPDSWEAVLMERSRRDGRNAVMRLAVALPAIDGTRLALTALESGPDRAMLHVLALSWTPPSFDLRAFSGTGEPPLSWWAEDDTGQWHTASGGSWLRHGDREWSGIVRLRPPLHQAAKSLELTITGMSERLRVKLPLCWHSLEAA